MRDLPAWAADYVGLPYKTHGRDRAGIDCWGLMCLVLEEQFGCPLPEYEGADWMRGQRADLVGRDASTYASQFLPVQPGSERLGDGILLRMRGHPLHLGLVLTPGWMLHASEGAGSVIETYHSFAWNKRITGFYRYEPLARQLHDAA